MPGSARLRPILAARQYRRLLAAARRAGIYTIIDVIPAGSQRADSPSRPQLALSADQMRFIFASVPKDRTANVRVRLALGAEAPRDDAWLVTYFPGCACDEGHDTHFFRGTSQSRGALVPAAARAN